MCRSDTEPSAPLHNLDLETNFKGCTQSLIFLATEDTCMRSAQKQEPSVEALSVIGNVRLSSRSEAGSRRVQHALESGTCNEDRDSIAGELRGHVWEAARCPHANHVIQKCIMTMRPQAFEFIIDEIRSKGACKVAKHQYGCRIMQRLLEHGRVDQIERLVEDLFVDVISLCKHIYGHFVMQHVLEHGSENHRQRLIMVLEQHAEVLGPDKHGSALFVTALCYGCANDQATLSSAILKQDGLITAMAATRHGHAAIKLVLDLVTGADLHNAKCQLAADVDTLRNSRYGRSVLRVLEQRSTIC